MRRGGGPFVYEASALHRCLRAACPPRDRLWVDALFGELAYVEGAWSRLFWLLATLRFVAARNGGRVSALLTRRRQAVLAALCLAALSGSVHGAGYEGLGLDDDLFLVLALALGVLTALLLGGHLPAGTHRQPGRLV